MLSGILLYFPTVPLDPEKTYIRELPTSRRAIVYSGAGSPCFGQPQTVSSASSCPAAPEKWSVQDHTGQFEKHGQPKKNEAYGM